MQVKAHSPNISSTIIAQQEDQKWILQIVTSMRAFQTIFKNNLGENAYSSIEEFKKLVLSHLKNNIKIVCDDQKVINISNGKISLGHEMKVAYPLINMPNDFRKIQVSNKSFTQFHNSKSTLIILKNGVISKPLELNKNNDFQLNLKIKNNKLMVNESNSILWLIFAFFCVILIVLITNYFYYRRK
ncbi:hypothetical protein DNU06_03415 [Putridiphycobacter roseus]|uniref:Uncharacterized protein n=1 Tax=Putridiphycobacter roseus TaxID=2219161 RepID=A0A2W1N2I9_9FLAO|nr:hypothetical protein [Putridiphycobacter roseus]PZE18889.1 hypothetical protein DNU06_03415 [Putridiphycobacter roseus]